MPGEAVALRQMEVAGSGGEVRVLIWGPALAERGMSRRGRLRSWSGGGAVCRGGWSGG